jgi:antitoxin component YwqK of YwqJK toxin-antitoxin module
MKYFLYALPLLLALSCAEVIDENPIAEVPVPEPTECGCDDLIMDAKYNWYYLNDRKIPFEGTCTNVNLDGVKMLERHYTTGKVHGNVIEWFSNGQMKLTMEFDMNMQTGEMKEWDDLGVLEYHASYDYGKLDSLIYKRVHYVTLPDSI